MFCKLISRNIFWEKREDSRLAFIHCMQFNGCDAATWRYILTQKLLYLHAFNHLFKLQIHGNLNFGIFNIFVSISSQEKLRICLLLFWLLERNIVELTAKSATCFQNKPSKNGFYQNGNDNSVDEIQFSNNNKNTKISGQQSTVW